uniref:Uncharacterized protein n=1 Tax=Zea mays TaxID=4577 RepID=A0A804RC31_MAIZE
MLKSSLADGVGQGLQRRRSGARCAGDLLPGGRLQRRRHAWLSVRVGVDGAMHGPSRGELPRRAASGYELPRRPRLAAGVLRPRARQRIDRRPNVGPRRRPPPCLREVHGCGHAGPTRRRSQGRGEGADVPDHRGAGRGWDGAVVGAQLRRHVARTRRVHALADHRDHQPEQPRQRARRAVRGVRRGPTGAAVPQHGQDRSCAGVHRVDHPARRRPAARAPRQPLCGGRVRRHILHLRLRRALVPRLHKQVRKCCWVCPLQLIISDRIGLNPTIYLFKWALDWEGPR